MLTDTKKRIVISTLGPVGTCSEYTAQYYLDIKGLKGDIELYSTFEEAIEKLKKSESDIAIVPSAYQNFAKLLFDNRNSIKITYTFIYNTPKMVIASKILDPPVIRKIATHPAPSSMIKQFNAEAEVIFAESNSKAALMAAGGEVDACMTNFICVQEYGLNVLKDFGSVSMSWNVFERI